MKYQEENQHFSHHHILYSLKLEEGDQINCDACEQDISEPFHGCIKCKYHLHDKCFNTPRALEHPSHPNHPLTLHQKPTYPSKTFVCNACGEDGNRFSLSCAHCQFDIHLKCAKFPSAILINKHPHELNLFFGSPYSDENTMFGCDICSAVMDKYHWLYYCSGCDFASHLECANENPRSKERPKKGKGKSNNPEGEKSGVSSKAKPTSYSPGVKEINALNEAEDELYATAIQERIENETRQAALSLWGASDGSSDDDYY